MKTNITSPSMPSFDEYCNEISDIWKNRWLTNNGPKHVEFEHKLRSFLGCDNISLFTNGHSALEAAIEVFNFPRGSEIITTPFTFVSTTNAIIRNGITPVFCDIEESGFTIDANKIEELITDKTVAIVAVHVYGNVCDVERIQDIANKHNLVVIYDAAHAFGVKYKGKSISDFGDITMFSFHATKVFNTIEGGALCFKNKHLKAKFESLKNFGINNETSEYICAGMNAKMNEFQACMGICNLRHIKESIALRKKAFDYYTQLLFNTPGLRLLKFTNFVEPNYSYFPCVLDSTIFDLVTVVNNLRGLSIQARRYFYPCTNIMNKLSNGLETPIALNVSNGIICLPIYPGIDEKTIDIICKTIADCCHIIKAHEKN